MIEWEGLEIYEGIHDNQDKNDEEPNVTCPVCGNFVTLEDPFCPYCGAEFKKEEKGIEIKEKGTEKPNLQDIKREKILKRIDNIRTLIDRRENGVSKKAILEARSISQAYFGYTDKEHLKTLEKLVDFLFVIKDVQFSLQFIDDAIKIASIQWDNQCNNKNLKKKDDEHHEIAFALSFFLIKKAHLLNSINDEKNEKETLIKSEKWNKFLTTNQIEFIRFVKAKEELRIRLETLPSGVISNTNIENHLRRMKEILTKSSPNYNNARKLINRILNELLIIDPIVHRLKDFELYIASDPYFHRTPITMNILDELKAALRNGKYRKASMLISKLEHGIEKNFPPERFIDLFLENNPKFYWGVGTNAIIKIRNRQKSKIRIIRLIGTSTNNIQIMTLSELNFWLGGISEKTSEKDININILPQSAPIMPELSEVVIEFKISYGTASEDILETKKKIAITIGLSKDAKIMPTTPSQQSIPVEQTSSYPSDYFWRQLDTCNHNNELIVKIKEFIQNNPRFKLKMPSDNIYDHRAFKILLEAIISSEQTEKNIIFQVIGRESEGEIIWLKGYRAISPLIELLNKKEYTDKRDNTDHNHLEGALNYLSGKREEEKSIYWKLCIGNSQLEIRKKIEKENPNIVKYVLVEL